MREAQLLSFTSVSSSLHLTAAGTVWLTPSLACCGVWDWRRRSSHHRTGPGRQQVSQNIGSRVRGDKGWSTCELCNMVEERRTPHDAFFFEDKSMTSDSAIVAVLHETC